MRHDVSRLLMFALIASFSCSESATGLLSDRFALPVEGTYQLTEVTQVASCSPQQLPAPSANGNGPYVVLPSAPDTASVRLVVRAGGPGITVTPVSSDGQTDPSFAFFGTITNANVSSIARTVTLGAEGPRDGGHTLYVTEQSAATEHYFVYILLPPGHTGDQIDQQSSGTHTLVFQDGGAAGRIFTTCSMTFTTSGTKVAN